MPPITTASRRNRRGAFESNGFAGSSKTERDAVIVVDKANNAAGKVRLNYLVEAAAWRPQYKIRAGKLAKDPVQVEYLAAIIQQTGEDWQGADVHFPERRACDARGRDRRFGRAACGTRGKRRFSQRGFVGLPAPRGR